MIVVIDYGAGNLRSVVNALEAIGQKPLLTNNPSDLAKAVGIILPGVGAFGAGIESLQRLNLIEALSEQIIDKKKPYLGICLGLQFLARESFEHGNYKGLGWVDGTVQKIVPNDHQYRIPHIGWNDIQIRSHSPLLEDLEEKPVFYFVHSYHLVVDTESSDVVTATCWHGTDLVASIQKDNIFAVQFHPEKSQRNGMKLLENFVKLI